MLRAPLLLVIAALLVAPASAVERSAKAKAAFRARNPCPATHATKGACPGYVIDHVIPLCAGGADTPANMQWQTVEDGKAKDRDEVRLCRRLRR